jgi:2-polyprenyl-6-methoxyphenol hydroxylase-like FAD-dependent oxidoreductase
MGRSYGPVISRIRPCRTPVHARVSHPEAEDTVNTADVIVVGAGPTGLMLAGELALAGVRCRVLERRDGQPNITRAFAVHARTLELLDARGLADDLVPHGVPIRQIAPVPGAALDLREVGTRYPMVLMVPQSGTEHLLERRVTAQGVDLSYGAEVVAMRQDADGVELDVVGPTGVRTERAAYVVGCDGAHSIVRRLAGIDFVGKQYETHILLADVHLAEPPEDAFFARTNMDGAVLVIPFGDGWFRVIAWDRRREDVPLDEPLDLGEIRDAFHRIAGTDFGMGEARWSSRFLSERRQARHYRDGRVFLAGDSAHVHSPLGGQGMNTGIQDAVNLGWKLGAAVHGWAAPGLLDSYEDERHPVGARVLRITDAFNQLVLGGGRVVQAVRRFAIRQIFRLAWSRRALAGLLTGVGIAYPHRRGEHPWVGRRMPDVECAEGRLYALLRAGRFVLLDTTGARADVGPWSDRVLTASAAPAPGLPPRVLVRPDGYVAWAGEDPLPALASWCGPVRSGTPRQEADGRARAVPDRRSPR